MSNSLKSAQTRSSLSRRANKSRCTCARIVRAHKSYIYQNYLLRDKYPSGCSPRIGLCDLLGDIASERSCRSGSLIFMAISPKSAALGSRSVISDAISIDWITAASIWTYSESLLGSTVSIRGFERLDIGREIVNAKLLWQALRRHESKRKAQLIGW